MPARRVLMLILPVLFAAVALGASPGFAAPEEPEPVDMETAQNDLGRLAAALKSRKSINESIIEDMGAVALAYHNLAGPAAPELKPIPEDASDEDKKAIEQENEAAQDLFEKMNGKFLREKEKYHKDALKLFLKAFKLVKIHGNTERNLRDDVNIRAAQILGQTGSDRVSKALIKALETTIFKAKYQVPQLFLEEAFAALGHLNDIDSLDWMANEFTHTKSSPPEVVDQLVAAHKAMILFKDVPGATRYAVVQEMQKNYGGVEAQARQSKNDPATQSAKRFWDKIKNDAIKAMQYFAGEPRNEDDEVLATAGEFQAWFRDHKNKKRAPWLDPKPTEDE